MNKDEEFQFSDNVFITPILLVILLWFIYWLEIKFQWNFNKYGVYPRTFKGLRGVFTTHFIHSNTSHLFNNSLPLLVLSASLFYFYKKVALKVLVYGGLLTGFITWLIARPSYHIGASGIVYLLFSFVFFSGIIKKHYRLVAMSLITIFLYGSMIWYVFPIKEGMSWEGHLSGFLVGICLAYIYRKQGVIKQEYVFTKTAFDDMFDDDGNYVPPPLASEEEVTTEEVFTSKLEAIRLHYLYKTEEE